MKDIFIHTIGIETYLSDEQINNLYRAYDKVRNANNDPIYYFNHIEKKRIFNKYADMGFRMEIDYANPVVKRFDSRHRKYVAEWIVTPAKLLQHGEPMVKLFTPDEYVKACSVLQDILNEIKHDSGVDLLDEAKLVRVDVAKDIESPSEEFTQEVIRLAKKSLDQYGYKFMKPIEEEKRKKEWKNENAVFFHNNNQKLFAKLYNKKEDMRIHNYDDENLAGFLRAEVSILRKYLLKEKYITEKYLTMDDLPYILGNAILHASEMIYKCIITPLWSGAMLSKDLQLKYIKINCKGKKAKLKKMMDFRRECARKQRISEVTVSATVERYYEEIGLSPLYTTDEVRYIPAFADLLNGTEDKRIRRFLS